MTSLKVDYLRKDELIYELLLRGESVNEQNENMNELRKSLRKVLQKKLPCDVKNLDKKISVNKELPVLSQKIEYLKNKLEEINEVSSPLVISRLETKLNHLKLRCDNLKYFKVAEDTKTECDIVNKEVVKLFHEFETRKVVVDQSELDELEKTLNEEMLSDEEFEQKLYKVKEKIATKTKAHAEQNPEQSRDSCVEPTLSVAEAIHPMIPPTHVNKIVYSNLRNPLENHLENFEITDGLNTEKLLKFLQNLCKIQKECSLTENDIFSLVSPYVQGPLLNKLLECKSKNYSLKHLQKELLEYFVPLSLREKLKNDLVLRPQHTNEPLAIYIEQIKMFNEILQCTYTEQELVSIIKAGINPKCRNSLTFSNNPISFQDLDALCVNSQNVFYNDFVRDRETNNVKPQPAHRVNQTQPKCCFICKKPGHLARTCYFNLENSRPSQQKNSRWGGRNQK